MKAFEFVQYCYRINESRVNEGAFFMASALRGICEDVVALRFLRKLPKDLRDEVLGIELMLGIRKTAAEQAKFFKDVRPFQPVLELRQDPVAIAKARDRLTQIGAESGLWRTEKKLPPLEQMAIAVGMRQIYDYFYRVTSDTVHFNPGVALRNGWGNALPKGRFGTRNFCRYYLFSGQIYGVFLFNEHCHTFKHDLALSESFIEQVEGLRAEIDGVIRWPEAITFEEMNLEAPNPIIRAILRAAHMLGVDGKQALQETLPLIAKAMKTEPKVRKERARRQRKG